jgi:hypothetical protein
MLERSLYLLATGRTAFKEALVRCQLVGPTIPDACNLSPPTILIKPALLSYQ